MLDRGRRGRQRHAIRRAGDQRGRSEDHAWVCARPRSCPPSSSPQARRPETLGRGERVRASPFCMRAYVRSPVCVADIRPRRGCAEVAARAGECGLPPRFCDGGISAGTIFIGSEIPFPVQPTLPPSDMRRDDRGRDEKTENSHRKFRGQLTAIRTRRCESSEEQRPARTDIEQKTEVSSTAGRSPAGNGRASAMLARTSPMRWDDISPHKGYMK